MGSRVQSEAAYRWWVLGIVMIGTLMGAIDTSIVNVSIPAIMADFGVGLGDIEWVVTAYMLAFATLMPLTAWVSSRMGHKVLYIMALIVFTIGSVLCGLAWNLPTLIIARVIQALGGGALTPTGMAMIAEVFPPHERGKAMGWWGVGVIVGPAFGPTLGGYLTEAFGWRSIFMINLPVGLLGLLLALEILRSDKPHASLHKPFDFWGFISLSIFLVFFLLGLSKGEHEGWTSTYIVTCAILAVLGFIGFILAESIVEHGIVDLSLFKNSVFTVSMFVTFTRSAILFGGVFLLPLFLQQLKGLQETESGLLLLPGSLVIGVFMPISGRLSDKMGPRWLTLIGLFGLGTFMFMYRHIDLEWSNWNIILPTLVRGVGIGLLIAPIMAAALNSVPKAKASMASSMLNLVQQVGGSIGIAVLSTVLSHRTKFHLNIAASNLQKGSAVGMESIRRLAEHVHALGPTHTESYQVGRGLLIRYFNQIGSVRAFQDTFLVGAGFVVLAMILAFYLPAKKVHLPEGENIMME